MADDRRRWTKDRNLTPVPFPPREGEACRPLRHEYSRWLSLEGEGGRRTLLLLLFIGVPAVVLALLAGVVVALLVSRPRQRGADQQAPHAPESSALRCPSCEREVQPNWKVCPYCGTKLGVLESTT